MHNVLIETKMIIVFWFMKSLLSLCFKMQTMLDFGLKILLHFVLLIALPNVSFCLVFSMFSMHLTLGACGIHLFKYLFFRRIDYHHCINLYSVLSLSFQLDEKIVIHYLRWNNKPPSYLWTFFVSMENDFEFLMKNFKPCPYNLVYCYCFSSQAFSGVIFYMPDSHILIFFFQQPFIGTKMVAQGFTVDLNKPLVCQVRRAFLNKCQFCSWKLYTSIFNFVVAFTTHIKSIIKIWLAASLIRLISIPIPIIILCKMIYVWDFDSLAVFPEFFLLMSVAHSFTRCNTFIWIFHRLAILVKIMRSGFTSQLFAKKALDFLKMILLRYLSCVLCAKHLF